MVLELMIGILLLPFTILGWISGFVCRPFVVSWMNGFNWIYIRHARRLSKLRWRE